MYRFTRARQCTVCGPRVAGPLGQFLRAEHLDYLRGAGLGWCVEDGVHRRADPRTTRCSAGCRGGGPRSGKRPTSTHFHPKWCSSSPVCGSSVNPITDP
jgi:hypothetical protein